MVIAELKNKLSQLGKHKLPQNLKRKLPQLDRHKLLLLAATALLCAFVGFGGTYLFSRLHSPGIAPGNYTVQLPPPAVEPEKTFAPKSEKTPEKKESVKVEEVKENVDTKEISDITDPETLELLDRLFQIAVEHKGPVEAVEPHVTAKAENIESNPVLDQIDIEPAISRDTGSGAQKSKLLVKVTNNSHKPFEGYICFQLKDSSGNPAGIEILKVERIEPGKSAELVSWVDSAASDLSYNVVGRFPKDS